MKLLAELRRRNVIRMAGLYLVGAWLLVQVAGTVLPWFNVPASTVRAPFDLEATPNFKARLEESKLRWPPPATIAFPPRK